MRKKILKHIFLIVATISMAAGSSGAYFTDQVNIEGNQVSTPGIVKPIVINEVYYDTNGRTYSNGGVKTEEEGKNEWIELYNPNSFAVNIKNYKIGNTTKEFNINPNISISAYGFVLLSHDSSTWSFWGEPSVSKINLGGSVGSGWLLNDGDNVYLKDSGEIIIDSMCYGTNIISFNPPCPNVVEGHSLERNPDGLDTNTASDFIDMIIPTPGI